MTGDTELKDTWREVSRHSPSAGGDFMYIDFLSPCSVLMSEYYIVLFVPFVGAKIDMHRH